MNGIFDHPYIFLRFYASRLLKNSVCRPLKWISGVRRSGNQWRQRAQDRTLVGEMEWWSMQIRVLSYIPSLRYSITPVIQLPLREEVKQMGPFQRLHFSLTMLNAGTGRAKPFSWNSSSASTSTSSSILLKVFRSITIWPPLASPQRRAARLVTLPMAS